MTNNPSKRRNGFRFELWCEQCHSGSVYAISQHKDKTFLTLEKVLPNQQAPLCMDGL